MKSIAENINESNSFSKISEKKSLKKNSSLPSLNKLSLSNKSNLSMKKNSNNKKFTTSHLSDTGYLQNENNSINNFAYKILSKNKYKKISLVERILLDFFINISEFNEKNFDFFVNFTELLYF